MAKTGTKPVSMMIPPDVMEELRKRKRERGINQQRSLEDALRWAFSDQGKPCWYWK